MFVALSTYLRPPEEIEALAPKHLEWLSRQFASGHFLGSGRRVPPTGAVFIGRAASLEAFHALLAGDPFLQNGLVSYEVIEFAPGPLPRRSEELDAFLRRPLDEPSAS
jgi:uncharacterized protein YciI